MSDQCPVFGRADTRASQKWRCCVSWPGRYVRFRVTGYGHPASWEAASRRVPPLWQMASTARPAASRTTVRGRGCSSMVVRLPGTGTRRRRFGYEHLPGKRTQCGSSDEPKPPMWKASTHNFSPAHDPFPPRVCPCLKGPEPPPSLAAHFPPRRPAHESLASFSPVT